MRGAAPRPVPPLTRPSATLSQWKRERAAADEGGSASATFSRREKVPRTADEGVSASASPTPHPAFGHPLPVEEGTCSGERGGQRFGYLLPPGEGAAQRRMRGGSASASPTPHPAFGPTPQAGFPPLPVGEGSRSGG